jgi:sulfonate transport system permease protein
MESRSMKTIDPIKIAALGFALALILTWQLLAELKFISPIFFPSPSRAGAVLLARVLDGSIWTPFVATGLRMLLGWVLASFVGIAIGAAIGSSRLARDLLEPTLDFIRPLPASAMIPVAVLFLGLSNAMSLAVIAFGAIWPVLLATVHGFSSVQPELRQVSAVLGFSRREFMQKIALPSAFPDIIAGLRVSLAISSPKCRRHCRDWGGTSSTPSASIAVPTSMLALFCLALWGLPPITRSCCLNVASCAGAICTANKITWEETL